MSQTRLPHTQAAGLLGCRRVLLYLDPTNLESLRPEAACFIMSSDLLSIREIFWCKQEQRKPSAEKEPMLTEGLSTNISALRQPDGERRSRPVRGLP
jgi:hypothetical protein